jgi:hypothetical protein
MLVGGTLASYALAWIVGQPWLVPVLNTAPAYPLMVRSIRRGNVAGALALMLVWAATLGAAATTLSWMSPEDTSRLFLNAGAYRREMFEWVLTGQGREADPSRFLPQHAAHAAIFSGLSLATGSLLSMPVGAALMNYMGHYAGALAARSAAPALTASLAWHPWAIARVISFVILGVVLAQPALAAIDRRPDRFAPCSRRLAAIALGGLLLDAALKWALAPAWPRLLRRAAGW